MSEALRIFPGKGIRIRRVADSYIISAQSSRQSFEHPFKVALSGNVATLRAGSVNGVPATIKGIPLGGTAGKAVPKLEWQTPRLNNAGRGWIAVEVTCDQDWAIQTAEIVQVASLDSLDGSAPADGMPGYNAGGSPGLPGRKARHPIAVLIRRKGGVECEQFTHFNLQHRVYARDGATDVARHFFSQAG